MEFKKYFLITFFFALVRCNPEYCDDLSPYVGKINLDEITGAWNGVEVIPHTEVHETENTDECFHIDITERYIQTYYPGAAQRNGIRHFILQWKNDEGQIDYYFMVNSSQLGLWSMEYTATNGSVSQMDAILGGIIQVMKASENYLVLNFCIRMPYSQLYTVVLARNENQITAEDLTSIHNIISSKDLPMSTSKRVCFNSAMTLSIPNTFFIILMSVMFFISISQ